MRRTEYEQEESQHYTHQNSSVYAIKSYAGFWRRFGAFFIDYVITAVTAWVCIIVLTVIMDEAGYLFGCILSSAGYWLYFALFESSPKQATLGKLALGIKVTDFNGSRISFGRATGRHFAKILSGITLGVGYILAGFTPKKQALHDMIASCYVVRR